MMPTRKQLEEALRFMRVPPDGYDEMLPLAERGFADLNDFARPRKVWARFPAAVSGDGISIGDGSLFCRSAYLARLFKNCRSCAALAVTLGPEVDRRTQMLSRAEVARAVAFDACASVWADSLCDDVEREVESRLPAGEFLTLRFSPGYGDVPMEFTSELLKILDASRRIGLTLTRKGMMIPIKSVTALIGISDRPERRRRACDECSFVTCQYRREGGLCHD